MASTGAGWGFRWVGDNPDLPLCVLRLLSRESPSGAMKAVLRKAGGMGPGEEKQFLEVCQHGTRWWATGTSVYTYGPVGGQAA